MLNSTVNHIEETGEQIKCVAYSIVASFIVGVGMMGNLLSLLVLNQPNLKGVMYLYLVLLSPTSASSSLLFLLSMTSLMVLLEAATPPPSTNHT